MWGKKPKAKLPEYPADHKLGMEVPEGGSNCDGCEYLAGPQRCGEEHFIEWQRLNGVAEPERIPKKTSRYCCDFFGIKK